MKIQTKLGLVLTLVLGGLLAVIAMAAYERERRLVADHQFDLLHHRQELWRKIVEQTVIKMRDKLWVVRENQDLKDALQARDWRGTVRTAEAIMTTVREIELADWLEIYGSGDTVLYRSTGAAVRTPVVNRETLATVAERRTVLAGVGNEKAREIAVTITFPIQIDATGELLGMATLATDITQVLNELGLGTGADVLVVNRRGRVLKGITSAPWAQIGTSILADRETGFTVVSSDRRQFLVSWFPMVAERGNLVARVVTIHDETQQIKELQDLGFGFLTILATVVLVAGTAFALFLRSAFRRLFASAEVLGALAAGDLSVRVETIEQPGAMQRLRDEFTVMAGAVNRLREELIAFARMRRSRIKQRLHLERLIRHRLRHLAGTLDNEAQAEVLRDLAEIETVSESTRRSAERMLTSHETDPGSDGLAMIALALEKLTNRISDQQDRLSTLVEELREALRTQAAYLALQQELAIAQRIQLSILPPALVASGGRARLHGRMVAAKEVGGDFFDFFALDDRRIAVVIGDVSGKGIPAAFFMTMCRTVVRALAPRHDSPGACLEDVNEALVASNPEEFFVTLFYAVLTPTEGTLRYANAGHNPPIHVHGGRAEALGVSGDPPIGILDGLSFRDHALTLSPGDGLVLYTDGVTEAFDAADIPYGEDRLLALLRGRPMGSPDAALTAVFDDVASFVRDAPQTDDITCLVLCLTDDTGLC